MHALDASLALRPARIAEGAVASFSCRTSELYRNAIGPFGGWIAALLLKSVLDTPNALTLPPGTVKEGYEVVPTRDATALVAYLMSLRADTPVFEAPLNPKPKPTNETTEATAAAPTNATRTNQ